MATQDSKPRAWYRRQFRELTCWQFASLPRDQEQRLDTPGSRTTLISGALELVCRADTRQSAASSAAALVSHM